QPIRLKRPFPLPRAVERQIVTSPSRVSDAASSVGKKAGPIRVAVPISYSCERTTNASPITVNRTPDQKSRWLRTFIVRLQWIWLLLLLLSIPRIHEDAKGTSSLSGSAWNHPSRLIVIAGVRGRARYREESPS